MSKLYVKETKQINADGDYLITIKTYKSRPDRYDYLVWV